MMCYELTKEQATTVKTVVEQFCKELSSAVGTFKSDKAVVDAARIALIQMGEFVDDEQVGGVLCDAANEIMKKVGWAYLNI